MEPSTTLAQAVDRLTEVAHVIFDLPGADEVAAVYSIGLVLPLTLFLAARGVGALVNFWRK